MEVVVKTAVIRHAKHTPVKLSPPTNQHPTFDALSVAKPTRALKGKSHIPRTCSLQAHRGLPMLSLTTKGSFTLETVAEPLISRLMPTHHTSKF